MFVVCLPAVLLFVACDDKHREQSKTASNPVMVVADSGKSEERNENASEAAVAGAMRDDFYKCESSGRVEAIYETNLMFMSYLEMNRNDIRDTSNITGLFCENDGCYLKHASVSFLDEYDKCVEMAMLTLVSEAKFLFSNFIDYNKNKIQPVLSEIKHMLPGEKFSFEFGNEIYELEAFGKKLDDDGYNVENVG
jgi:hypothetical protein